MAIFRAHGFVERKTKILAGRVRKESMFGNTIKSFDAVAAICLEMKLISKVILIYHKFKSVSRICFSYDDEPIYDDQFSTVIHANKLMECVFPKETGFAILPNVDSSTRKGPNSEFNDLFEVQEFRKYLASYRELYVANSLVVLPEHQDYLEYLDNGGFV